VPCQQFGIQVKLAASLMFQDVHAWSSASGRSWRVSALFGPARLDMGLCCAGASVRHMRGIGIRKHSNASEFNEP